MSEPGPAPRLDRVLVLAPYRKDADFIGELLEKHGIAFDVCLEADCLEEHLSEEPGVLVATHEGLVPVAREAVADHLMAQPSWSELPILILLDKSAPHARMRATLTAAWPRSRQIYYERPVAALELVSGIQSALLARVRQREVRDHIERETELRRELNHRVKNMLASVLSIFQMTQRRATSIEQLAKDFQGRLMSLANVHSAIFRAGGESVTIEEIIDLTFAPYRAAGDERIAAEGPPLTLTKEAGTTLALCLHELVTNAIKYGALSNSAGRVDVRWSISAEADPKLTLQWTETGGPPVEKPSRQGYGTGYIRAALTSLVGAPPLIEYHSQGLSCSAAGPLARLAADHAPRPGVH